MQKPFTFIVIDDVTEQQRAIFRFSGQFELQRMVSSEYRPPPNPN